MAVNEHYRFVENNLLGDALFNSFKLFNRLLGPAQFKQTFRDARIHFDVLVDAKAKSF